MMPFDAMSESVREVLPWSTWASTVRFRICTRYPAQQSGVAPKRLADGALNCFRRAHV